MNDAAWLLIGTIVGSTVPQIGAVTLDRRRRKTETETRAEDREYAASEGQRSERASLYRRVATDVREFIIAMERLIEVLTSDDSYNAPPFSPRGTAAGPSTTPRSCGRFEGTLSYSARRRWPT